MKKIIGKIYLILGLVFLLTGCSENHSIVNNVDERDANEILVFLSSKGIPATKSKASGGETATGTPQVLWNIEVPQEKAIEAMSILNYYGLPRKKGTTLLQLFQKQGLMTTDKEETIRYQAGMEEELKNIIRKIDGVLDADVQISFPSAETPNVKMKAAVYVKHQGVLDDPNNHLETKIKRLISGSIDGLAFENVAVIADKARFSDINLTPSAEKIAPIEKKDYVSIWSIVMAKASLSRFRFLFFTLIFIILGMGGLIGYSIYKYYPHIRSKKSEEPPK